MPEWWRVSDHRFKWIVAHVCYGSRILSAEPWRHIFPVWLSYSEDIHALLVTDSDITVWASLGKSIVDAAVSSRTIKGVAYRVRAAYWKKMAELMDSTDLLDGRNLIHEMHLQRALDCITTSEDLA